MAMKLLRFRVEQFRSVDDSSWIECSDVTTLIGVNEAGKSNILLALWKLNPAKGGEINLRADMPRRIFAEYRNSPEKLKFIEAHFELDNASSYRISGLTGASTDEVKVASVSRNFKGNYSVGFPKATVPSTVDSGRVRETLIQAKAEIEALPEAGKGEDGIKAEAQQAIENALKLIAPEAQFLRKEELTNLIQALVLTTIPLKSSKIHPVFLGLVENVKKHLTPLERSHPSSFEEARKLVMEQLPSFVYYSNYGNLDSEIYLPHVIENLKRNDLSSTAEAKARTLRVLFEFVKLKPEEILELGKEPTYTDQHGNPRKPTEAEVKRDSDKKAERDILLQSASSKLTRSFEDWWKQGDYKFRFAADGNHFRIWVSDKLRPEEVELEGRSTGLQWFLSFYLVFLVERQDSHDGAVLLLDEAGLSLHPLAQKDLTLFFDSLAQSNQIVHTTHSPFLIDTNHVDQVKVVYVDEKGHTVTSEDLRAAERDKGQIRSVYAVHAALGLSISETLLQGCLPIIVEGTSDQFYLNAIKNFLITQKKIAPNQEIVFVPAGGTKGVSPLASILSSKGGELPPVLLDSDEPGRSRKGSLASQLYKEQPNRLVEIKEFSSNPDPEVEDIIPFGLMSPSLARLFKDVEIEAFDDVYDNTKPFVGQVEAFAAKHGVVLPEGWKVEVARQVKQRLQTQGGKLVMPEVIEMWKKLFERLLA